MGLHAERIEDQVNAAINYVRILFLILPEATVWVRVCIREHML